VALTLETEQRLIKVGLVELFERDFGQWEILAQRSYTFFESNFPNSNIRADDVAKILISLIEINSDLVAYLSAKKLTQKYWIRFYCDLIIDRTWSGLKKKSQMEEVEP
jgi:hypothetical protein